MPASAKRTSSDAISPSAPWMRCAAPHADIVAIVNTKMFVDLHVPGAAAAQPLGDVLDQRDQREQGRRDQQRRRDQEDAGRVVALVAGRAHDEELRHGDARRQQRRTRASRRVWRSSSARNGAVTATAPAATTRKYASALGGSLLLRSGAARALDRVLEGDCAHSGPPVPFMPRVSFDAAENRKQLNRPTRPDRRVCRVWGCGIPRSRHGPSSSPERVRVGPACRPHPRSVRYGSVGAAGGSRRHVRRRRRLGCRFSAAAFSAAAFAAAAASAAAFSAAACLAARERSLLVGRQQVDVLGRCLGLAGVSS